MKLFDGLGPNPQVVRMFLAELGMEIETVKVDIMAGENREEGHLNRNPMGQLPTLELDDGSYLAEITAICEYLDDLRGGTELIGTNPEERAVTRMWTRRISLNICEAMTTGFRGAEGYKFFKDRLRTFPESADEFKAQAQENLLLLDGNTLELDEWTLTLIDPENISRLRGLIKYKILDIGRIIKITSVD